MRGAYDALREHLGFGEPGAIVSRMGQTVEVDERILEYFDIDVRGFSAGSRDRGGDEELDASAYRDEWGVIRRQPAGSEYYDIEVSPLAGNITPQTIAHYPWPDPTDPGPLRGLRQRVEQLRKSDYAVMFNARLSLVHTTQYLRGFEPWCIDLGEASPVYHALMEAVLEVMLESHSRVLREIGDLIDLVAFGDDLGLQDRPLCSVPTYRRMIRPYQERIIEMIRRFTKARIVYHTCGSVYRLMDELIGLGIEAVNPVQLSAKDMDPVRLKREFGSRIAFWGGMDSQRVLPAGSPEEVRAEVQRLFEILGENGGYVLASVHNIQADVPPENVVAMFEAGRDCVYERRQASAAREPRS
jgi:uroporphyrinogen decarboxylase